MTVHIHTLSRFTIVGLLLVSAACKSTSEFPDSEVDKAKMIKELREDAKRNLDQFRRSEGEDLEALLAYSKAHETTTKVDPDSCPRCFAEYGASLSRIGLYYETLVEKLQDAYRTTPAPEQPALQAKIESYSRQALENYTRSNQQFEVYFSSSYVDPRTYIWVFRQSAALGDFDKALYYLQRYEESVTLTPVDSENLAILRKQYERGRQRQRERELQQELTDEDERRLLPGSVQPAN